MSGGPPFFAFGSPGGRLMFPVQAGRPVLISREDFEGCCCWSPSFFAGAVSGVPGFAFRPYVDAARGFAYAFQGTGEYGALARIELATGRIDIMPVGLYYGMAIRLSDGSLFSWVLGDPVRRWLPHLWTVGGGITAVESGAGTAPEEGVYAPDLDRVLIPNYGVIRSWEPGNLAAGGTVYETTSTPYGVHALRWEAGKLWWIEGDGSSGGRWSVGGTVFTTGPGFGTDIVPLTDLGRAVLVGHPYSTRGCFVVDTSTGAVLHSLVGHGHSAIGGCFRVGMTSRVVVFDIDQPAIRIVDAADGTWEDIPTGTLRYGGGWWWRGKCVALPFTGAAWGDVDCGIRVF